MECSSCGRHHRKTHATCIDRTVGCVCRAMPGCLPNIHKHTHTCVHTHTLVHTQLIVEREEDLGALLALVEDDAMLAAFDRVNCATMINR